jgi:hypothetical protein
MLGILWITVRPAPLPGVLIREGDEIVYELDLGLMGCRLRGLDRFDGVTLRRARDGTNEYEGSGEKVGD